MHQLLIAAATTSFAILGIYASAIYLRFFVFYFMSVIMVVIVGLAGFLKATEVINFQKIVEGSKTIDGIAYTR